VATVRQTLSDDDHQISYQALPRGVPVVTTDGVQIGTVQKVLDNAREHIFDGIVVRTENGDRFVDAPEVARITLRQVTLTIDAGAAAALQPPRTDRRWWPFRR
jgi:sporulation protein YlmC with PRC-barrel domain